MTISLKHNFLSPRSDGSDPTLVQPSNWNDEHDLTCANDVVLGRASAGTGPIEEILCTPYARSLLGSVSAEQAATILDIATVIQASQPAGKIDMFAMQTAPDGWLACDGAAVSRTVYARLFTAIGTTWGNGNGTDTFNVPDFRGYFPRGYGTNGDGTASAGFAVKQADDNKEHTHTTTVNDDGHAHSFSGTASQNNGYYPGGSIQAGTATKTTASETTGITVDVNSSGTEARPKNIAVFFCIKT